MAGFILMIAGVLGLYAKGNQWVNAPKPPDPVLVGLDGLAASVADLAEAVSGVERRVTALEAKDQ